MDMARLVFKIAKDIVGFEHPSKDALWLYLREHPDADKSLHWVKGQKPKQKSKPNPEGIDKPKATKSKSDRFGIVDGVKKAIRDDVSPYGRNSDIIPTIGSFLAGVSSPTKAIRKREIGDPRTSLFHKNFVGRFCSFEHSTPQAKWNDEATFSSLVKRLSNGNGDDFRMKRGKAAPVDDATVSECRKAIEAERELLRNSGLVNKDGTITLYRRCTMPEKHEVGERMKFAGNYVDSWSLHPNIMGDESAMLKGKRHTIKANIPVDRCLYSFIGMDDSKAMVYANDELEIGVNGYQPIDAEVVFGAVIPDELSNRKIITRNREIEKMYKAASEIVYLRDAENSDWLSSRRKGKKMDTSKIANRIASVICRKMVKAEDNPTWRVQSDDDVRKEFKKYINSLPKGLRNNE